MYTTPDERFLVMELEDGEQFQEGNRYAGAKSRAPFVRTSFEKYTKIFDMQEFDINRTDEELFRTHYSMLSMNQLVEAIDSIDQQVFDRKETVSDYIDQYINALKPTKLTEEATENTPKDTGAISLNISVTDDTLPKDAAPKLISKVAPKGKYNTKYDSKKAGGQKIPTSISPTLDRNAIKNRNATNGLKLKTKVAKQTIDKPLKTYDSILETFPDSKRQPYPNKAIQHARSIKSNSESAHRFLVKTKEKRIKHVFELYSKYSFAVVCFVFLFIGAPMGALVRKGGFGYPLLIAIIFFMLFITLTLTFKRMAEAFVVHPILAVWLPNLIILPIGFFLTYKAMNDAKVFDTTRILAAFQWVRDRFQ